MYFSLGGMCFERGEFVAFFAEDKVITMDAVSDDSVPRILQGKEVFLRIDRSRFPVIQVDPV